MTSPTVAPYGAWKSPITSEAIVSAGLRLGDVAIDGTGVGQKAKVRVDLLGRGIGDSPVVEPISTDSTVAFGKIGTHRAR